MRPALPSDVSDPLAAEVAWAAVAARDARQDGRFVYAVATTGVFCRPSCGSRRPLKKNVRFFSTPAEATRAGFRACKRCKPADATGHDQLFSQVRRIIDTSGGNSMTLDTLAKMTGATPTRIHRSFKRALGLSPKQYSDTRRGELLRKNLRSGSSVTRATIDAGYGSSSRVHDRAGEVLGMTPNAFRNGGKDMHIQFGTTATPMGTLLVAYTERGICSVALGDSASDLEAELRTQFSAAEVTPGNGGARHWIGRVVEAIGGNGSGAVPLDISGTEFQLLVWHALQRIPRGETRSYAALAASVGRPTAIRAVARACAQNRVAIVIPCHRVVREDGALGGYRWGVDRKRRLLDHEASVSKP